jgi:hypothetical protein
VVQDPLDREQQLHGHLFLLGVFSVASMLAVAALLLLARALLNVRRAQLEWFAPHQLSYASHTLSVANCSCPTQLGCASRYSTDWFNSTERYCRCIMVVMQQP